MTAIRRSQTDGRRRPAGRAPSRRRSSSQGPSRYGAEASTRSQLSTRSRRARYSSTIRRALLVVAPLEPADQDEQRGEPLLVPRAVQQLVDVGEGRRRGVPLRDRPLRRDGDAEEAVALAVAARPHLEVAGHARRPARGRPAPTSSVRIAAADTAQARIRLREGGEPAQRQPHPEDDERLAPAASRPPRGRRAAATAARSRRTSTPSPPRLDLEDARPADDPAGVLHDHPARRLPLGDHHRVEDADVPAPARELQPGARGQPALHALGRAVRRSPRRWRASTRPAGSSRSAPPTPAPGAPRRRSARSAHASRGRSVPARGGVGAPGQGRVPGGRLVAGGPAVGAPAAERGDLPRRARRGVSASWSSSQSTSVIR